jgi:two-component system chemotaxis sensor kinase CheA
MAQTLSHILELTRAAFRQEAEDLLSELDSALLRLEASPTDADLLNRAFRAMHTLKGSGATAGFTEVSALVHDVEDIFNGARDGRLRIDSKIIDLVLKIGDVVRRMLSASTAEGPSLLEEGMKVVGSLKALVAPTAQPQPGALVAASPSVALDVDRVSGVWEIHFAPDPRILHTGNDPLSLLRDLLGLGHGVVRANTSRLYAESEIDPELCYLSWDVQLATEVSRERLRDVFLFVEEESELRIEPVALSRSWALPAGAYFGPGTAKDFREEATEDIAEIEAHVLALEEAPTDRARFDGLRRSLHNLKGLSRLLLSDVKRVPPARHPLRAMSELCHAAETFLESFDAGAIEAFVEEHSESLLETVDWLKALLRSVDEPSDEWPTELLETLGAPTGEDDACARQSASIAPAGMMLSAITEQCAEVFHGVAARLAPDAQPAEAEWRTVVRVLSTLEKATAFQGNLRASGRVTALVAKCEAHARSEGDPSWERFLVEFRAVVAGFASPQESAVPSRHKGRTISLRPSRSAGSLTPGGRQSIGPSKRPAADGARPPAAPNAPAGPPPARSVRVDQEKLDVLMGAIGELLVAKNALPVLVARVRTSDRGAGKEIDETVARIAHITDDLQNAMRQIRMMPIRSAFQRFPRMIRDLARSEDKQVQLIISGDETELDKTVLEQIGDPLVHLVRNAIDHGIELPGQRVAQGKPEMGTVGLQVLKEGSNVVIRISDDGRGMDPRRLRAKAVEKGLYTDAEVAAMSDQRALELIFLPGFSTAEKVTDISGRGVGMDVVQSNIRQLRGTIAISSELGRGSMMSITLPSSLMVSKGMLVDCASEQYVLPIEGVREMVKVRRDQLREFRGVAMMSIRGAIYPVFSLARLLGLARAGDADELMLGEESNAAIVVTRSGEVAILVDRLVAEIDVIVKPLSTGLDALTIFQGATILGDGTVSLILDVGKLDALVGLDVERFERAMSARATA